MLCKAVKDLEEQGFKRNGGGSAAFIVEELKVASDSVLDQVVSGVGVGRMWDSISRIIG
jgi:hypothetical protein